LKSERYIKQCITSCIWTVDSHDYQDASKSSFLSWRVKRIKFLNICFDINNTMAVVRMQH